jgi:ketosteroid isomerase-like protein
MKRTFYLSLFAGILVTGCQFKANSNLSDVETIRKIENQWANAVRTKDLNKVLDIYASDAIEMPPNEPIAIGREAIKKGWEEWFNDTTYLHNEITSKIDTIVVSASGDLGYMIETNHYKVKTPKGTIEFDDKCIYIFNKRKDGWKCTVGIWNSDKQPSKTN